MMRSQLVQSRARLQQIFVRNVAAAGGLKGNGKAGGSSIEQVKTECQSEFIRNTACSSSKGFSGVFANGSLSSNQNRSFSSGRLGDRRYATQAASNARAESTEKDIHVQIPVPFELHLLDDPPSRETRTSKEELMSMYRHMTTVRRMEIAADLLFKSQFIRGFCHLYDGQEAVSVGMEAVLTFEDSVLTAYRDHGIYIGRGGSVFEAFSEMMGRKTGCAIGKGGSMHLYKKENNYYGGWGIVGTSGPLGTGVAFANKYLKTKNVCVTIYGDGAANQGQLLEAQNIAALMNLPVIYLVENNHYGMGTAEWRASKKTTFFDRLTFVPGIKVDGMDVFSVKNAFLYAKEHCLAGKGPIIIEADTYRYHGHSMSDPGSTYRDRSEIQGVRQARDPIEHVRKIILKEKLSTPEELKGIEKKIRAEVEEASSKAKEAPMPDDDELFSNIYRTDTGLVTYGCDRSKKVELPRLQ